MAGARGPSCSIASRPETLFRGKARLRGSCSPSLFDFDFDFSYFGKADFLDPLNTPRLLHRSFLLPLPLSHRATTGNFSRPLLPLISPFLPLPSTFHHIASLPCSPIPTNPPARRLPRHQNTFAPRIPALDRRVSTCACSPIERHPFNSIIPRIQSTKLESTNQVSKPTSDNRFSLIRIHSSESPLDRLHRSTFYLLSTNTIPHLFSVPFSSRSVPSPHRLRQDLGS